MRLGFISAAQADLIKEEISMFPLGGNLLRQLMRRGILSAEQVEKLSAPEGPAEEVKPASPTYDELDLEFKRESGPGSPSGPSNVQRPDSASRQTFTIPPRKDQHSTGIGSSQAAPQVPRPGGISGQGTSPGADLPPQRPGPLNAPGATAPNAQQGLDGGAPGRRSISDALNLSRQAMGTSSRPEIRPAAKPAYDISAGTATPVRTTNPSPMRTTASPSPQLMELFRMGRERDCSDLHLTVGKPPYLRQQGKLFFLPEASLTAPVIGSMITSLLSPAQQEIFEREKQLDFSFELPNLGRYRANVYHQRLGPEAEFRFIPQTVPTLKSLGMPPILEKLTTYPQGLNLVTGPAGCGKTTTVAAMLEYINQARQEHIITVEDPVEYVLHPKSCQITQREVGTHTNSFAHALRTALRQDPDVIMIGELRDLETTSIAITAAETGHLVFGTLHTSSAIRTVARILDVYPPSQRPQICMMVAESLRGILSQQLLPRKDGQGRACAMEILVVTTGVAQVIKEGKTHQLVSHMQSGRKLGMRSMDDALMDLVQSGAISGSTAWSYAENKGPFEMMRTQS